MKWLKRVGIVIIVLYCIICTGLYFIQDNIIFDPHQLDESHTYRVGTEFEIPVAEGVALNALHVHVENSKGAILYFHGNKGNLRRCIRQIQSFAPLDQDVYMVDYRGYGKSDGVIHNEQQFLADAQKVYDYVKSQIAESKISIVGYSLGSAPASYLTGENNPKQTILIAPFVSIANLKNRFTRLIPNFLIKYPFNNARSLAKSKCPITIIHGTDDNVIPYDSSIQLESIDDDRIELITLNGGGHRDAIFSKQISNVFR